MNRNEPLFRVVKRDDQSPLRLIGFYVGAVVLALLIGTLLLTVLGVPAGEYYKDMFTLGMIDNKYAYKQVEGFIKLFVPLLLTSLALSLAFKMRFWNIGGEGQFILGAIGASAVAFKLGETMPQLVVLLLMAVCGLVCGGLYGVFVAWLRMKYGTNETLMTLMLNYIALYFLQFLGETKAPWNFFLDPKSERPKFAKFPDGGKMITFPIGKFNLNLTLIIAILICVGIYVYLKYTKQGYEIAVVGDSPNTARYAGMNVGKIVIRTIFLSAAMIGLAGAFYVASAGTLSTSVTNDVGWTGVIVAWLAQLNTIGIVVASLLITVLQFGSQVAGASYSTIDANFADLLQGIILFIVLAADFFTRFKLVWRSKSGEVAK